MDRGPDYTVCVQDLPARWFRARIAPENAPMRLLRACGVRAVGRHAPRPVQARGTARLGAGRWCAPRAATRPHGRRHGAAPGSLADRSPSARVGVGSAQEQVPRFWGVEAPGWQGARRVHTGSIRPTSNAARRDKSAAEHGKLFVRGPLVVPVIMTVTHRGWRGARLARRDEGANWGSCDRGATPSRRDASPAECYRNYERGHLVWTCGAKQAPPSYAHRWDPSTVRSNP